VLQLLVSGGFFGRGQRSREERELGWMEDTREREKGWHFFKYKMVVIYCIKKSPL
jgi:hypothetical protein